MTASGEIRPMTRRGPLGVFEAIIPGLDVPDYHLRVSYPSGVVVEIDDPYRYGRVLTDFDLHLLGEGTHYRSFEKLGAHRITSARRPACTSRCGRPTRIASA